MFSWVYLRTKSDGFYYYSIDTYFDLICIDTYLRFELIVYPKEAQVAVEPGFAQLMIRKIQQEEGVNRLLSYKFVVEYVQY